MTDAEYRECIEVLLGEEDVLARTWYEPAHRGSWDAAVREMDRYAAAHPEWAPAEGWANLILSGAFDRAG